MSETVGTLTAEELAAKYPSMVRWHMYSTEVLAGPKLHHTHATVVFAPRDQPFGFTHDDVKAIRDLLPVFIPNAWEIPEGEEDDPHSQYMRGFIGRLRSIADRIAALLPAEQVEAHNE